LGLGVSRKKNKTRCVLAVCASTEKKPVRNKVGSKNASTKGPRLEEKQKKTTKTLSPREGGQTRRKNGKVGLTQKEMLAKKVRASGEA